MSIYSILALFSNNFPCNVMMVNLRMYQQSGGRKSAGESSHGCSRICSTRSKDLSVMCLKLDVRSPVGLILQLGQRLC